MVNHQWTKQTEGFVMEDKSIRRTTKRFVEVERRRANLEKRV